VNWSSPTCFQANGQFPERLYFALLTPRRFRDAPRTRSYGYRLKEYQRDPDLLAAIPPGTNTPCALE
jgi:hypothetical protein